MNRQILYIKKKRSFFIIYTFTSLSLSVLIRAYRLKIIFLIKIFSSLFNTIKYDVIIVISSTANVFIVNRKNEDGSIIEVITGRTVVITDKIKQGKSTFIKYSFMLYVNMFFKKNMQAINNAIHTIILIQ